MQLQQQSEELGKQTLPPTSQLASEHATPALQEAQPEGQSLTPQPIQELLMLAEQQKQQRWRFALLGVGLALPVAFAAAFLRNPATPFVSLFTFLFCFIASIYAIRYRKTTAALARIDDVRMVGPLIDRLHSGRRGARRTVRKALARLLPLLRASDAGRITAEQQTRLVRHLSRLALFQRDKEFQIVILRALQQIGDAQAIPVVESIIQRPPRWSEQERVHAAAVECLPFLLQRAEEASARQTLLRASHAEEKSDGGELLRPAEGVEEADPQQLLRASSSQD